jgi:hypothetical protein
MPQSQGRSTRCSLVRWVSVDGFSYGPATVLLVQPRQGAANEMGWKVADYERCFTGRLLSIMNVDQRQLGVNEILET